MTKHFSILKWIIFSAILLICFQVHAGLDPCSLLTTEEVSQVMGTSMRSSPIMNDRCYFIGEYRELTVVVMDKAGYDRAKQSPLLKRMGMKIAPLEGVSPEAFHLPVPGGLDATFAKGDNAVTLQIRTKQGPESDTVTAQELGKLIIQRLP
jgi:hypothetical protein